MTKIDAGEHKPIADLAACSAGAAADIIRASQSGVEGQMTLAQVKTYISANLTAAEVAISGVADALSAMSFTTTGATSGAIAAVTSASNSFGFASKGQIEALIEQVIENKANLALLSS